MKLVDHLRALLSQFVSKKDGEFISTQGLSTDTFIELSKPTVNGTQTFVAPCNGFLNIGTEARGNVESAGIASWGQIDVTQQYDNQVGYAQDAIIIPLKRGNTQYFSSAGAYRFVRFYKMYGGGNSIPNPILLSIRGGGLCLILSHFLTHLRAKSDCRSLLNMSRMNFRRGVQTGTKQIFLLLRHLTDLFKFAHGGIMGVASQTHRLKQEEERFLVGRCGEVPQNHLTHEHTCLSEKATKSLFNYQLDQVRPLKEESLSLSASVRSLSFGGALC